MEEEEAMLNKEEEEDDDEEDYNIVKFENSPLRNRAIMVDEVARRLKNGDLMMRIEAAKEVRKMVRKSSNSNSKSAVRCRFAAVGAIEPLVSMLNNWFPLSAREAALLALLNLAARNLRFLLHPFSCFEFDKLLA